MIPFGLAILLGAFLLFQVQPILGKCLIPWFGGGAGTWTTCILFFQCMLLAGYGYARFLDTRLSRRRQVAVHLALLVLSLAFLPLATSGSNWQAAAGTAPELAITGLLLLRVGLPYLLLSATGPLLQSWFAGVWPDRSPYRLYALSNLGSLLALLTYPFLVEPLLGLPVQGLLWTGAFVAYGLSAAASARRVWRRPSAVEKPARRAADRCQGRSWAFWVLLSAAGSLLLMGTTSLVCQELTAMPLLWVLPLALYLLTFVICFDRERCYRRALFVPAFAGSLVLANLMLHELLRLPMWWQVAVYGLTLFTGCMLCHGELARSKPPARQLTSFYLAVATGGALGGLLAVAVAPLLFSDYWEYHLALLAVALLAVLGGNRQNQSSPMPRWATAAGGIACIGLALSLVHQILAKSSFDLLTSRNFYGVLHVQQRLDEHGRETVQVIHGRTIHGAQFTRGDKKHWPITYYGRLSGIGIALAALEDRGPLRIGVVGLGAGTIAALARPGDSLRFYEINPAVERLAREQFTYLADSAAEVEVVLGDGRLALAREAETGNYQGFDLLAIDAFHSDSVPVHLLTREALEVYRRHLRRHGYLAFHVSNRYVDLLPVLRGLAAAAGMDFHLVESPGEPVRAGTIDTQWVVMTPPASVPPGLLVHLREPDPEGSAVLWTDAYGSLLPLLRRPAPIRTGWRRAPLRGTFVVDRADLIPQESEDRAILELRRLYRESGGGAPVVVGTLSRVPEGQDLAGYAEEQYGRLQLAGEAFDFGVLLLVRADGTFALQPGPGWQEPQREALGRAVAEELQPPLGDGALQVAIRSLAGRVRAFRVQAAPPRWR